MTRNGRVVGTIWETLRQCDQYRVYRRKVPWKCTDTSSD